MQELGRQPLFQLIGAIIVLLITDWRPVAGAVAAIAWILWVATAFHFTPATKLRLFATH
jgi:hypothetical protein